MANSLTGLSGFTPPIIQTNPLAVPDVAVESSAGVRGAITDVHDFLAFVTDPSSLIRFGEVVAGGVLVIVGVIMLGLKTDAGQAVTTVATKGAL